MSPRNRAFLRWAFVIIFLIIAPVIILSTAGYRFNFGTRRLERTGVIVVDTVPSGASVSLNGRLEKPLTPARLTRVSPGTYRVRIEKTGFRPWEKDIAVDESQTLFLNDLVLLRDALPSFEREQANVIASAFSPDDRYAAAVSNERGYAELHAFDFKTGLDRLPYRAPVVSGVTYGLSWSADSQRLFIARADGKGHSTYYLWDQAKPLVTTKLVSLPPSTDAGGPLTALPTSSEARGAARSSDDKRILYWSGLELHVFDVATNSDELVTRVSGAIMKATWYANDRLILYATADGLSAIESGHEGARVTTSLAVMRDITDFAVTKSGDTAWIIGVVGHQQGIFSLKLK